MQEETYIDPESLEEVPLAPGMSPTENMLRWGFIRKVYGIISAQLLLTVITCSVVLFSPYVLQFSRTNVPFQIIFMLGPLIGASLRAPAVRDSLSTSLQAAYTALQQSLSVLTAECCSKSVIFRLQQTGTCSLDQHCGSSS